MTSITKNRCARCGKRFKKGGDSFRLKAELISHFDGYIRVNPNDNITDTLDKIRSELEKSSQEEIEKQVYQRFDYIVCPACRDDVEKFLAPGPYSQTEERL